MERNGAPRNDGAAPKKRKAAGGSARGKAAEGLEDESAVPPSAVKKSKRAAGARHESEFVSVEVGLRAFHKRMASSGGTPAKPTKQKAVSRKESVNGGESVASGGTKKVASRKKTAVVVAMGEEDAAAAKAKATPAKRGAKAAAAVVKVAAVSVDVAAEPVAPKKRATPTKRAAASPPVAGGKRAVKPKPTSDALAQARAAAAQQQQDRVQQRVKALQRPAHAVDIGTGAKPCSVRAATEQQTRMVAPTPPPLQLVPSPGKLPPQAESIAKPAESVASTQEDDNTQSSQGFIDENFDEDLAFLQALEEVERKLQPAIAQAPAASAPVVVEAIVAAAAVAPLQPPAARETAPVVKQEPAARPPPEPTPLPLPQSLPIQSPAIPAELLAEYERLKRENEALRRSNEQLQAKKTPSSESPPQQRSTSAQVEPEREIPDLVAELSPEQVEMVNESKVETLSLEDQKVGPPEAHESTTEPPQIDTTCIPAAEGATSVETGVVDIHEATATPPLRLESSNVGDGEAVEIADAHGGSDDMEIDDRGDVDMYGEGFEEVNDTNADASDTSACGVEDDEGEKEEEEEESGQQFDDHDEPSDAADEGDDDDRRVSTIDRGNYTQYRAKESTNADEDGDDDEPAQLSGRRFTHSRPAKSHPRAASHTAPRREMQRSLAGPTSVAQGSHSLTQSQAMPPRTIVDDSETEHDEEDLGVQKHRAAALSESSGSSDSDDDGDEGAGGGESNVLDAALRAATGRAPAASSMKGKEKASKTANRVSSQADKRARAGIKEEHQETAAPIAADAFIPEKRKAKKRRATPSGPTLSAKDKSTLLWPTLDDFYDFVLDLTPRRVLHSDPLHLQLLRAYEKARTRLPMQYVGLPQYCDMQQEAILEELVSSVRNSEEISLHSSNRTRLWLSSISPCSSSSSHTTAVAKATSASSTSSLNPNVIFMESGFSGTSASGKSDFIVTFQDFRSGPNQKSALNDFVSGDLLALRSPQWRDFDIHAFGIVLCSSVVAVGGSSSSNDKGSPSNPDQLCVLLRAPSPTDDDPDCASRFASVIEMCLVNQQSAQWSWSLEQVHNLTTSAREFQAVKSVSFFKPETKEMLMSGTIPEIVKSEQTQIIEPRKKLTSGLYEELEGKYNQSQLQAILGSISDDSAISIIQGPPGTGKTKTILGLLSTLLDGAAISATRQAQAKSRIRVGASLQEKSPSATANDKKTVAQNSIRVLVAAPSNAAVDELIVRLLSEGVYDARQRKSYRPRIVRVGRPESLQQQLRPSASSSERQQQQDLTRKKKWRKYASEVEEILLENLVNKHKSAFPTAKQVRQTIIQNVQIVFCTLSGAGSVAMCELQSQHFDALVIDEAAQAVEASLLIPFKFQPSRVVLVGDHRQLPATVISKRLIELGYDRSLFQRLVENGSRVFMLTQQYRMHPEISWFPSTYFYNSKLVEAPQMKEWTARKYHRETTFRPFVFYDVVSGQQSQVSGSKSLRNMNEIECIIALLTRLVVDQFPELEWRRKIGIIAPYKQQIYELRNELQRWEKKHDKKLEIEVNTVDGFQGREKEVIIYSCVRTSRAGQGRSRQNGQTIEAFWADERRMNVAITRAKSSLWIIGNSTLLKQSAAWRALITHAKDSRRYLLEADLVDKRASEPDRSRSGDRSRDHRRDRSRSRDRDGDRSRSRR